MSVWLFPHGKGSHLKRAYNASMATLARKAIEAEVEGWSQTEVLELVGRLVEIAREKSNGHKVGDLSPYRGILKTDIDALEYQRQIRAEWD